jgi:hypothetical protein
MRSQIAFDSRPFPLSVLRAAVGSTEATRVLCTRCSGPTHRAIHRLASRGHIATDRHKSRPPWTESLPGKAKVWPCAPGPRRRPVYGLQAWRRKHPGIAPGTAGGASGLHAAASGPRGGALAHCEGKQRSAWPPGGSAEPGSGDRLGGGDQGQDGDLERRGQVRPGGHNAGQVGVSGDRFAVLGASSGAIRSRWFRNSFASITCVRLTVGSGPRGRWFKSSRPDIKKTRRLSRPASLLFCAPGDSSKLTCNVPLLLRLKDQPHLWHLKSKPLFRAYAAYRRPTCQLVPWVY